MSIRPAAFVLRPRSFYRGLIRLAIPLAVVVVSLAGCAGPLATRHTAGFVEPPRDKAEAALANDPIKVSDTLRFNLPGDSTAALNGTYTVAADGSIQVAGSGKIQVAGKTMEEAQKVICDALLATDVAEKSIEIERNHYFLVAVTADGIDGLQCVSLNSDVTVKDALRGIPKLSSKIIWIARTNASGKQEKATVLPVDWDGINHGDTKTNYRLRSGDYLFVAAEPIRGAGRFFDAVTSLGK